MFAHQSLPDAPLFSKTPIFAACKMPLLGLERPSGSCPRLISSGSPPSPSSVGFHALPAGVSVLKRRQRHTVSSPGPSLEYKFGIYTSPLHRLHPGCLSGTPNLTPSPHLPPALFSLCISLAVSWHQALNLALGPSSSLLEPAV